MKVLLSWLREFTPVDAPPAEIGDALSGLGLAVEEMVDIGKCLEGVVVAEVLATRPHPQADRIQLVDVDAGDGEALQVACGAFNMALGDKVPLATLGTTMANGMVIERRKMRGEFSNGMLCAANELGFGDRTDGIWILDSAASSGTQLGDLLGLQGDVLYDLEINPNRPDAMSVAGVARDLAARYHLGFNVPEPNPSEAGPSGEVAVRVEVLDTELCGRFMARVLRGITIGPSPAKIAARLALLGMRPINNVVDVSNYVMLELGQPNHTYDLARVPSGHLRVRRAQEGETIVTLDGVERILQSSDGVICNEADEAIGIAGVMGGLSTEISETTTEVLLEMAWWDPMSIARTSTRLSLRSEASMRFERGADPDMVDLASRRFAELLDGVSLAPELSDQLGQLPGPGPVRLRTDRVNGLLGTELSTEEIVGYLAPIGFECTNGESEEIQVAIPGFRSVDCRTETDLIEEVARHHGYESIAKTIPKAKIGCLDIRQAERRQLRSLLSGQGCSEALPIPFLAPGDLQAAGVSGNPVVVTNPLDAKESVLRTSLRPGLLKVIAHNEAHRQLGTVLFEIGKVFERPSNADQVLPDEREDAVVVLAGFEAQAAVHLWAVVRDYFDVPDTALEAGLLDGLHPSRAAHLLQADRRIGSIGEVDPDVLRRFGVQQRVAILELNLDALLSSPHGAHRYRAVSRFPSSDLDLAFRVPDSVPASEIARAIRSGAGELLASLALFDTYRGDGIPSGWRSLAYRLRLQSGDHTLEDEEIVRCRTAAIEAVASQGGELRD